MDAIKAQGGAPIPRVTIKTGMVTPDGREDEVSEYLCDSPGCSNMATRVLGVVRELRAFAAVCDERAPTSKGASH